MAQVNGDDRLRDELEAAIAGTGGALGAADRLCLACVEHLSVDGAAISLMHQGATRGTFVSSGEVSRRLDEFHFTFGEGPCLDAIAQGRPVLVSDLGDKDERRWPAFTPAVLEAGVHAVFALPLRWRRPASGSWTCSASRPARCPPRGSPGVCSLPSSPPYRCSTS